MVIPWIGREVISSGKLYTNFWKVWHCILAWFVPPSQTLRAKVPSKPAEYWEQTWFDVLTKRKLKTHRAVDSGLCFRHFSATLMEFPLRSRNWTGFPAQTEWTQKTVMAGKQKMARVCIPGALAHLWVLIGNGDTWLRKADPWRSNAMKRSRNLQVGVWSQAC